jgi:4-hydroxy-3-methylbut-2-enyl diphosphate reductase
VTKVHHEVRRFATDDAEILLIGHEGHEEVEGTAGEAVGKVRIVDGLDGARSVVPTPGKKLVWLSQTTLSVDETLEAVAILKERFPEIQDPPSDDICYATQNRQEAIKQIAPQSDLVLVVGSTNSSNSVRLVEVAKEYGTKNAYLIDFAEEADDGWLDGVETIGVTSGASVPEILVRDLLAWLAERGFGDVQEVTAREESLLFSLPPELRKDMKAAGKLG